MRPTPAALSALAKGDMDNFMTASTPGGIEAQEAAGQATFVASETLPKDMRYGCSREVLERWGFKFGPDHDDLFVKAALPSGWAKRASDHAMWSYIHDDKGRKRASIFYKAAFYDRSASMTLSTRFSENHYLDGSEGHYRVAAFDGETELRSFGEYQKQDYDRGQELAKQACDWIASQWPQYMDPTAHWD